MNYYFTQFKDVKSDEFNDIVIGFDFGTSSSKIIIRSPFILGKIANAIYFEENGHDDNKYLLPTRPFFNEKKILELGSPLSKPQFPALKMRLIDKPNDIAEDDYTNVDLAVGYIAKALRISRKWFIETQAGVYGDRKIRWHFNLGIPSTGHKDEETFNRFNLIAKAAWNVSVVATDVNLENCKKVFEDMKGGMDLNEIASDRINIIPEVSAQVMGYIQSTVHQDGSHLLIDVGAGTVDICYFTLNLEEDTHSLLLISVQYNGVFELHSARINEMRDRFNKWIEKFGFEEDPIKPIPINALGYFPKTTDNTLTFQMTSDETYQKKTRYQLHFLINEAKKSRDPNSPQWDSGVISFLTGGGRNTSVYNNAVNDVNEWLQTKGNVCGLRMIELPQPPNLNIGDPPIPDYQRLSVAFGLSHTKDELGKIIPEYEIGDLIIEKGQKDISDDFISKDQV